jgi:hypothetical protein
MCQPRIKQVYCQHLKYVVWNELQGDQCSSCQSLLDGGACCLPYPYAYDGNDQPCNLGRKSAILFLLRI